MTAVVMLGVGLLSVAARAQNYDGKPDPAFGISGAGWTNYYVGNSNFATALVRQTDGKILAAGTLISSGGHTSASVVRLNPDGSVDPHFGSVIPGVGAYFFTSTSFPAPTSESASAIAVQSDGKIVVAGSFTGSAPSGEPKGTLLFRLMPNGDVDTTFGEDQGAHFLDCEKHASLAAIWVLPDNRILTAGTGQSFIGGTSLDFCVTLHDANGHSLIQRYADFSDGTVGVNDYGSAIAVSGSRVIVAGSAEGRPQHLGGANDTNFAAAAFTLPNLDIDASFGPNPATQPGMAIVPFDAHFSTGESADACRAVAIRSDGGVVLGGESYVTALSGTISFWAVARLQANGTLSSSFGSVSLPGTRIGDYQSEGAYNGIDSLVLQSAPAGSNDQVDESILFGGNAFSAAYGHAPADFGIHRMLSNGVPDLTFGNAGDVIFSPGGETGDGSPQYVTAMLLDANRPLAVGVNYTASSVDFLFLRLQNDRIFTSGF
ncbi:MAG: hypothetical protein ABI304_02060 [Rudaea sp.]